MASQTKLGGLLDSFHQLALVTAAICHDIDHPGNTNAFEISSASELALRYNDRGVLENHHSATAWSILRKPANNIFAGFTMPTMKKLRMVICTSILFTDMSEHFSLMKTFFGVAKRDDGAEWSPADENESKMLANVLLHSADLSNPTRPWVVGRKWAKLIGEEFNNQVAMEKEMGLPWEKWMQTNNELEHAKGEGNFIKFVIRPWWETIATIFPFLDFATENLETNFTNYGKLVKEEEAKLASQEAQG